jgi:NAD dependent epimerase/dehydratase family enzyme
MFIWAIETDTAQGIYNATSPGPVTNREFMARLRKVLRRPWAPRTPAWMVQFGCFVLRSEAVLALTGRRGVPVRLLEEDFSFRFPELGPALEALFWD